MVELETPVGFLDSHHANAAAKGVVQDRGVA